MYVIVGLLEDCPTEEGIQVHQIEERDYHQATYNQCQNRFAIWGLFHSSPIGNVLASADKIASQRDRI